MTVELCLGGVVVNSGSGQFWLKIATLGFHVWHGRVSPVRAGRVAPWWLLWVVSRPLVGRPKVCGGLRGSV